MSALADGWELDPDALTTAALQAPRCRCGSNLSCGGECCFCGREIRAERSLSRQFRCAAYQRRLSWARGAGLDPCAGFRGLSDEVGANPPLPRLDDALTARLEALLPAEPDDAFVEDLPALMAA